jgi:hypothetical protein
MESPSSIVVAASGAEEGGRSKWELSGSSKNLLVTLTYKLVAKKGRKKGGDCGGSPFFNKAMV